MSGKPEKLEIDSSHFEKLLNFQNSETDQNVDDDFMLAKLMSQIKDNTEGEDVPWTAVTPTPGFVVKTRTDEGDKVFVNICHTDTIPSPRDISDDDLITILESDDASDYRVPMSIGNLHIEADKSGNICSVYDIAINTDFLNKITVNELFRTFLMTVVLEGLQQKYSLKLPLYTENPYTILKNRKQVGTLQVHRIEIRPVRTEPVAPLKEKKKLIEVISSNDADTSLDESGSKNPAEKENFRMFLVSKKGELKNSLVTFARLESAAAEEIIVDLTSDTITISEKNNSNSLNLGLPHRIDPEEAEAEYFVNQQILKLVAPVDT